MSEILSLFAKKAEEKGWIKKEEIKKEASSLDLSPSGNLLADLCKLSEGLRRKGFTSKANDLDKKIVAYKVAEADLYSGMLNDAHPDGDVQMFESQEGLGVWNTGKTKQKKMLELAAKQPRGLASIAADIVNNSLTKYAQVVEGAGVEDAGVVAQGYVNEAKTTASRYPVNPETFTFENIFAAGTPNAETYNSVLGEYDSKYGKWINIVQLLGGNPAEQIPNIISDKEKVKSVISALGLGINVEDYYTGFYLPTSYNLNTIATNFLRQENPRSVYTVTAGVPHIDVSTPGAQTLIKLITDAISRVLTAVNADREKFNTLVIDLVAKVKAKIQSAMEKLPRDVTDISYESITALQSSISELYNVERCDERKSLVNIIKVNADIREMESYFWVGVKDPINNAIAKISGEIGENVEIEDLPSLADTIGKWRELINKLDSRDDKRKALTNMNSVSAVNRVIANVSGLNLVQVKERLKRIPAFAGEIDAIQSVEDLQSFVNKIIADSNSVFERMED